MSSSYPDDWRLMPLGEIVTDFISGGTPNTNVPAYWNGSIPWITGVDAEQQIATEARKYITEQGVRESATHVVPKGNILLVTRTGVGKVSIAGVDIAISQDLTGVIPNREISDVGYLYRQLKYIVPNLQRLSQGTIILGIRREQVEALAIPLPPLPEQRRIAEILDAADEAIRAAERVIAKLRQIKAGLLHDLLTRGLNALGRLRDPVTHPEQFKDSPLGRIPREWEVIQVSDLGEVVTGTTPSSKIQGVWGEVLPFITPGEIHESGEITRAERWLSHLGIEQVRPIPKNSILAVCIGSTLGKVAVADQDCATNQQINSIVLTEGYESTFVYGAISYYVITQILRVAGLQAVPIVNKSQFSVMKIPVAPLNEQSRIATILDAHEARIRAEEAALAKLRQVKRGLMDDLLTGRVRCHSEAPLHAAEQSALARRG